MLSGAQRIAPLCCLSLFAGAFVENNVCLIHLIHARLQLLNWPAQKNSSSPDGLQKRERKRAREREREKNLEKPNAANPVGLERVNHGV